MTTVSRDSFVSRLSAGIDVDNMGQGLAQALGQAGIDPSRLRAIAGADGKIQGAAELGDLFELCDELDRNGSARSFVTARAGQETEAGAVYAALQDEIGRRRAAARMHG